MRDSLGSIPRAGKLASGFHPSSSVKLAAVGKQRVAAVEDWECKGLGKAPAAHASLTL